MAGFNPLEEIGVPTKKKLVIFFVIDRSGSMGGTKMNQVNQAMREAIPVLRGIGGSDADLQIAVLTFAVGAQWTYSDPVAVEQFNWSNIEADGWTDFGAACNELCDKLSRKEFLNSASGYAAPVVILLTDGEPTDSEVWPAALARLKANRWFQYAIKIALAVDDADRDVLIQFVGTPEGVFDVDPQKLKQLIKVVAITSSQIGSKSVPIDIGGSSGNLSQAQQASVYQGIQTAVDDDLGVVVDTEDDWD
jgi:uncharacterized protein YegL